MPDRSDLIVGGYFFGSFEDSAIAQKELKNAKYLEERLNSMRPSQMKSVYDKMLDEKVFSTPVGWEYLKYLRGRVVQSGIDESEIRPIPLYINFSAQKEDSTDRPGDHIARERIRPSSRRRNTVKDILKISVIANVFLLILVILMFVITIKSDNPNILNYKEAIINEYASWEEELDAREEAIKEKEKELEDTGSR
ncbi:MAG: hypothetical protein K5870_06625 [Lachnospiraceae bacterium]|nr:hypothetical protein [Lachnospiraceae bacterium]